MTTKHLRPAPGRQVLDLQGRPLPPEGRPIPWEPGSPGRTYWRRLLRQGDALEGPPPESASQTPDPATNTAQED